MARAPLVPTLALVLACLAARPAYGLGEYNDMIESACAGHPTRGLVERWIFETNQTVSMHPDIKHARRIIFMSGQRWLCRMHSGNFVSGATHTGWGGEYRITTEQAGDAVWIILSPTHSPGPND